MIRAKRAGECEMGATGFVTKRGGVCNPAAYVLCELLMSGKAQYVTDGMKYPVRL